MFVTRPGLVIKRTHSSCVCTLTWSFPAICPSPLSPSRVQGSSLFLKAPSPPTCLSTGWSRPPRRQGLRLQQGSRPVQPGAQACRLEAVLCVQVGGGQPGRGSVLVLKSQGALMSCSGNLLSGEDRIREGGIKEGLFSKKGSAGPSAPVRASASWSPALPMWTF